MKNWILAALMIPYPIISTPQQVYQKMASLHHKQTQHKHVHATKPRKMESKPTMSTQQPLFVNENTLGRSPREPHKWSAFASDLALPVGEWPAVIEVTPPIGNGMSFKRGRPSFNDDELQSYEYHQEASPVTLTIFND